MGPKIHIKTEEEDSFLGFPIGYHSVAHDDRTNESGEGRAINEEESREKALDDLVDKEASHKNP